MDLVTTSFKLDEDFDCSAVRFGDWDICTQDWSAFHKASGVSIAVRVHEDAQPVATSESDEPEYPFDAFVAQPFEIAEGFVTPDIGELERISKNAIQAVRLVLSFGIVAPAPDIPDDQYATDEEIEETEREPPDERRGQDTRTIQSWEDDQELPF